MTTHGWEHHANRNTNSVIQSSGIYNTQCIAYSGIPRVDELPRHDINLINVLIVQLTALNDCMVGNFRGFKI